MKCVVCNEVFCYESIVDIAMVQEICNKCSKLFKYDKKSVKINTIIIKVYYFRYYVNINLFVGKTIMNNINKYIITKKVNGEFYDLKMIKNGELFLNRKKLDIVFCRSEFNDLKKVLQLFNKIEKRIIIRCYEICG